jgi:hypothetical protein
MAATPLFERRSTYGGFYAMLIVNRLQMLYMILILPMYLIKPCMIWFLIALGLLSQLNMWLLSKWLGSDLSTKGYQGFVQLFGERTVRVLAALGLIPLFVRTVAVTSGYAEIVRQYIFPAASINWPVFFIVLTGCYVASHGIDKTIRFTVIAFIGSIWLLLFYIPFYLPPIFTLQNLYPLYPIDWSQQSWHGLLMAWSSFSGPEYIIVLVPWLNPKHKSLKFLTAANAMTTIHYLLIFAAALFFYGSVYLKTSSYPAINMIRYLQSPILERMEIVLISFHMFHVVFSLALFLLFFYGGVRIIVGKFGRPSTRFGYFSCCLAVFVGIVLVNKWLWSPETELSAWFDQEIWFGAVTYTVVPALLFAAMKLKGRAKV